MLSTVMEKNCSILTVFFAVQYSMMSARKEYRKGYRKNWMANRRKIQQLKKTAARVVVQSDSDSDSDSDDVISASHDVRDTCVPAVSLGGADVCGIASQVSHSVHSLDDLVDTPWDSVDLECTQECLDSFSDSDECTDNQEMKLADGLRTWAVDGSVPRVHVNTLLPVLNAFHPQLPLTADTLLKHNQQTVKCSSVSGGDYVYLGFHDHLCEVVSNNTEITDLQLALNVDGVPLFASSKYSLWPILCYVMNVKPHSVFVVAIYGGYSKPCDLQFLQECVNELKVLTRDGLVVCGRKISCSPKICVCDAVARAMVKGIKQFSGYYGCDKCSQRGLFVGRMTYPSVDSALRTDASFRALTNEEHHNGSSPFLDLPVDMISFFPIDYMHQVCLGVVKRLLVCWTSGGKKVRLSHTQRSQIDARLTTFRSCVTAEFNRKPRPLSELAHWKATEFRTFLLYAGYFCLRGVMDDELLNHFLCLSLGIAILVSETLSGQQSMKQFAQEILVYFVGKSRELYGPEFLVYNVHSLVHLSQEVEQFGALDNVSAFVFENFLQVLKRSVRCARNPVVQAVNRLQEKAAFSKSLRKHISLESTLGQHPTSPPNNSCILEDGRCCQVVSVDREAITCMVFADTQPVYTVPCDSRIIGVFRSRLSSGILKQLPPCTKTCKAMSCVGFLQSEILFIQLLHTM